MKSLQRIVLYTKDIKNITGKKDQAARKLHQLIREANNKSKDGFVTIEEFCDYTGTSKEEVMKFIK